MERVQAALSAQLQRQSEKLEIELREKVYNYYSSNMMCYVHIYNYVCVFVFVARDIKES